MLSGHEKCTDHQLRIDGAPEEELVKDLRCGVHFPFLLTRALLPKLRASSGPVEFVFIGACFSQRILSSLSRIWLMSGVLLYVLKSLDDDNVKAHAIYRLRRRVRKQFPGNIKMNTRLATFCWAEISDVADGISAVDVPIQAVESRANKTGRKRGRPPVADKTFVTSAIVKKPRERKAGASP